MQTKGWMMFNALINRYHHGPRDILLKNLSEEEAQLAISNNVASHDITAAVAQPSDLIRKIHYSWLVEPMQHLPQGFQSLILSALPPEQVEGLLKLLKAKTKPQPSSKTVAQFLAGIFYRQYIATDEPPPQLFPQTTLSFLANLDKSQLVRVIDYLGLHDLAHDVQRIVDKVKLKKIFLSLPSTMQRFLKICLQQGDCLSPPPLPLDTWNGQRKTLIRLVHRRGLTRLGKALSGHPEPLVQYLCHVLDTGRGVILSKCYSKEALPSAESFLETQIINVVKFLNEGE